MLRIAICDDDINFIQEVSNLIDHWPDMPQPTIYDVFDDGDSLITAHKQQPFDIILLDVVMPMLNGISTAGEIRQADKRVKIVFLSNSPEFALDSYTVKANNYLLKSTLSERLYSCLNELVAEMTHLSHTITVKGLTAVHNIALHQILYIEAQNKHIVFYLLDGSTAITTDPLRHFEELLTVQEGFFKCHRSYIINLNHIDTYTQKEVRMHSGYRVPISRSCHKDFESAYFSLIFGKAGESK